MTEHEILLVKDSWNLFRKMDPHQIGNVFYSRLFLQMPSLRSMFKPSMKDQYAKIVDMLDLLVSKLHCLDEITEDIRQLAIRHTGYGVTPGQYKLVGDALLWTLAKGLGKGWTEETAAAWTACYSVLSDTMINAAQDPPN
jgi:nitric oxide dioxygenase